MRFMAVVKRLYRKHHKSEKEKEKGILNWRGFDDIEADAHITTLNYICFAL